jgi:two-component system chemotaxis response regulator CheB
MGASAGGVEALSRLVALLPEELPAAILAVVHFPQSSTSVLPSILSSRGKMRATHAQDGEPTNLGHIYISPPGRHMLVDECGIKLVQGPKENGNRPAIDPLFRTAARSRGSRVASVLLSGLLDDGTLGTAAIRSANGIAICQDPSEATFGDMPRNAINNAGVDFVLPLAEIAKKLVELAGREVDAPQETAATDPTGMSLDRLSRLEQCGHPSRFVCPECGGTLFELHEHGLIQFQCRIGHTYLPDSLAINQEEALEAALWTATRAIQENNDLLRRMLARAESHGYAITARHYRARLEEGVTRLDLLTRVLGLRRQGGATLAEEPQVESPVDAQ